MVEVDKPISPSGSSFRIMVDRLLRPSADGRRRDQGTDIARAEGAFAGGAAAAGDCHRPAEAVAIGMRAGLILL